MTTKKHLTAVIDEKIPEKKCCRENGTVVLWVVAKLEVAPPVTLLRPPEELWPEFWLQ